MNQKTSDERDSQMIGGKISPQLIAGIFVTVFFAAALSFRIVFPYSHVFVGDWIKYTGTDAWYHMRIVDNLVHNFPNLNIIDPYLLYPVPMSLGIERFFDYFLATIIWIVGLGAPTQHTVNLIGVYLPAILGALAVIPVFFIGTALINRWVGVLAAGLIAFSPGEFLGRSIIGQADHHVLEVLLSTIAMLFIILAVQNARQKQMLFSHLKDLNWPVVARPLIYSVIAGTVLGLYLNSWLGALLFIFILFAYLVIQFIIDYIRGVRSDYLCFVGAVTFLITLLVTLLFPHVNSQTAALGIALISTIVLGIISAFMMKHGVRAAYYVVTLLGFGLVELAIFYAIKADLLASMMSSFAVLVPTGARQTIEEAEKFLFPQGEFSFILVWLNFTTGSIIALVALGIFIYHIIKKGEADKTLIVAWSIIILVITLSMRRFAYYLAVNVAILAAYSAWLLLQYFGFRGKTAQTVTMTGDTSKQYRKKEKKKAPHTNPSLVVRIIGIIIVFFATLFPNILYARNWASFPQFTPSDAWCESLDWLRTNTPEPYGTSDSYYALYHSPFNQPASAYGVVAHWDYGYWIARMGQRAPIINPGILNGRDLVSKYFLAQDEIAAMSSEAAKGSKYVIVDYDIAMPLKKYYAWMEHLGVRQTTYYDVYVQRSEGKVNRILLYYPEYYRSLAVRLYNFDGSQVVYQESTAISYEEKVSSDGTRYREITNWKSFPSYNEAIAYIQKQKSGNYRIVSPDPFISPVPLESLNHYKLVYSSKSSVMVSNTGRIPEVKIFEYSP